ncbi:unnamed protein product, partial [Rotaria sordida]
LAVEVIHNMRTIKQLSIEKEVLRQYRESVHEVYMPYWQPLILSSVAYSILWAADAYTMALLYRRALVLFEKNELTADRMIMVFGFALFSSRALRPIGMMSRQIAASFSAAEAFFNLFDRKPAIDNTSTEGQELVDFRGEIKFDRVKFFYPTRPASIILNKFQLNIKPSQRVALVGMSSSSSSSAATSNNNKTISNDAEIDAFQGLDVSRLSTEDIIARSRLLDNEVKIMKNDIVRISHETQSMRDRIKDNKEKIKVNKTLPYLVSNVIELFDLDPQGEEDEGANIDLDAQRKGKCAVIKTSTRQTYFLPVIGLVDPDEMKPADLVGVNKDSYLVLEKLPVEYDSRVKAMEVDERPTEQYGDIGGLDKQIQELIEAVVLPMTHKDRFEALGIQPPKGVLLYGPPGTGKTLLARACAAQTKSAFLKLAGPQLVQMFIGDGAKLVRDAFALAKEKAPAIIFIDELDAIGTKRFDSEKAGDREVQRTMLELLNQLDGFQPNHDIKVIAATNRVDILDPALLRSGRLDRKIEFPHPNETARARIMQIHSRKMNTNKDVNFEELARCTDDFNGAQCKAVCIEAGMIALRRSAVEVQHEDFMDAILEVQAKKKMNLNYYA